MKVLDYSQIVAEIESQLNETDYDIEALIGSTLTKMIVVSIYLTNDILKAHGQNLEDIGLSVITTRYKCSVIFDGNMSWYKLAVPLCGYNNLTDDIESILMIIQACIDRMDE